MGSPDDASSGYFESPNFTHIRDGWYTFTASW
jgi:hypothetical protein